jgi:hypothetical protein
MKIRNRLSIFLCFLSAIILSSCEAVLHYEGNIYDHKNEPVENVYIALILNNKDTITEAGDKFDTISLAKRKELRKKGVKDNFRYTSKGLSEPVRLYTDKNGYFTTTPFLVSCLFKCPKVKMLVQKDKLSKEFTIESLEKIHVKNDSIKRGSFRENISEKYLIFL